MCGRVWESGRGWESVGGWEREGECGRMGKGGRVWENGKVVIKWTFKKYTLKTWIGLIWLRIGVSSGLFLTL
jgi:hypothetical protein